MVSPFLPDADKVAAVREALPATAAGIYLNTGSVGPLPAETATAMADLAAWESRVGRAHPDYWQETLLRLEEARAVVAAVLTSDVDRIALTHSCSHGMNVASWAADWRRGGRAVTTSIEHIGALGPLYTLRDRWGIDLAIVDVGDGGDDERTIGVLAAAITPDTRLVSVSHVSWATGAVLPVARIAELAHERGALMVIDGAQAAGAIPVAADELGADFYALSGQKWLLGPEGMGALWAAPSTWDAARQTFASFFSYESHDGRGLAGPWPSARRFELASFHRPSVVGFARSIGWLSMFVGLEWAHARARSLAGRAADLLAAIPGITVVTPRHQMATLVTFRIVGWPAERALEELGARTFAIARTIPALDALRLSVGFFNTEAELERVAEAVEVLARHTPESLPPRRALAVLGGGEG